MPTTTPRGLHPILKTAALLALGLLLSSTGRALWAQQDAANRRSADLVAADKLYAEKSYAGALTAYESLLKSGDVPAARKDDLQYRVGVCLGKTEKWDRALAYSLEFVKTHRRTVWEPRGLYWLGRLYLGSPHQAWRVGKTLHRGNEAPQSSEGARPERVFVAPQDQQNARDAMEAARVYYPAYRAASKTEAEEIQLDFDLARVLQSDPSYGTWLSELKWLPPADPSWEVDPAADYSVKWDPPRKVMYLFEQAAFLGRKADPRAHQAALAVFGKAVWLRHYRQMMESYSFRWENGKRAKVPYPYESVDPEAILRDLIRQFPEDPVRDQAQYSIGMFLEQAGKPLLAEKEYRRLIEERPQSKWVEDARYRLQEIARPDLYVTLQSDQDAGKAALANISYRNVKTVRFEVYRLKLEELASRPEFLADPTTHFQEFRHLVGELPDARKRYGPRVAAIDVPVEDPGDRAQRSKQVTLPVQDPGAYVVETSIPGYRTANVLVLTDLVLVQKAHRDGALYFATDAKSGAPVPGVQLLVRQWWYEQAPRTASNRAQTGAEGLASVPFQRGPNRSSFQIAAVAWKGNRYAVTHQLYTPDRGDNPGTYRAYSVTDRSVYRPGQTVFYRQMMMKVEKGETRPLANEPLRVEVYDPKGQLIHERAESSNAFGSVSGDFDLISSAPLGEYSIQVRVPNHSIGVSQLGGNRFRVEEYKKPEFQVTVSPGADRVKLGEKVTAKVKAEYYFGGPVPNAKVSYRVYRNYYAQSYRFPRKFDFLYDYSSDGNYDAYYRNGEVMAQGEARTNDKGEAEVTFSTSAEGSRWPNADLSFTVDADVQDASRRTISGSGTVKATRHDVAVFMDFPHGYATKGDRVDVEVVTLNPSDQPVSAAGMARVYRQPETPDAKEKLIHEHPLKTDARGRAILKWTADTGGYYRLAFETKDTGNQPVAGSIHVWVEGPELAHSRFLFQQVMLAVEDPYYEEGQTAKVLLVAPEPDCTVLLTREVNNEISDRRVLKISGRSMELKIPITRAEVPNFYLSAVLIRNGQMYNATAELFAPPVRQLAAVSIEADRERYQPGEKAKLRIKARDWQGRPLRTELSVSVSDASLAYIQKSYAPEIRRYYYGNRRSMSIEMNGSPGMQFQEAMLDNRSRGQFKVHEWVLPEGMGQLTEWPGASGNMNAYYGLANNQMEFNWYAMRGAFRNSRLAMMPMGGMGGIGGGGGFAPEEMAKAANEPLAAPGGPMASLSAIARDGFGDRAESDRRDAEKPAGGLAPAPARTRFSDLALWVPTVLTDAKGEAAVEVTWPDNLTQWRANTVGTSAAGQVGSAETSVRTRKDLLVRLQAPRFFVERDVVLVSANVHNYQSKRARVLVKLDFGRTNATLEPLASVAASPSTQRRSTGSAPTPNTQHPTPAGLAPGGAASEASTEVWLDLPAESEKRVDWALRVQREGDLRIRMSAQSEKLADAAEMTFPVLVHGVERFVAQNGVMRAENRAELAIELPEARKPGSSELIVQLNPSLGAVMLDALPYLVDYPYGCIEQTMSRFLPAVVVGRALKDAGVNLEQLRERAKQVEERERRPGSTPVEHSPYSYPKGRPGTIRVEHLSQIQRITHSPVFDTDQMTAMVRDGLGRIQQFQHADGGWGWWPGDSSDPYMTSYVIYGLITAKEAGYAVDDGMLNRGLTFLLGRFKEDDNFHRMAYEARVLGMDARYRGGIKELTTGRLYANRERLSAYSKALLSLALHEVGDDEKAGVLLRNLETTAKIDEANGTASWGEAPGGWWCWWNNRVETNAAVLQAYVALQPQGKVPGQMVKWLVNNRRGNTWYSTRETAMAVYSLADYVRATKELAPDYALTVDLGGKVQRKYAVNRENALFFDNQFVVPDELLETGKQPLTLAKEGPGSLYYSAYTRYFSLEEPIKSTGNEIFVTRRYFRLIPGSASGQPEYGPLDDERENPFLTGRYELLDGGAEWVAGRDGNDGPRYEREPVRSGDTVASGDLLEVELQLESKNDYEYLVFEDLKPAGCEPVELRSGGKAGIGTYSSMELRDQKVAFFLTYLPQGRRTLIYRLRAEIPGKFHVLPTNGYAMYAPDIRTLSDEMTLGVREGD
jgi:uncharacterized protein YfaS (alpha-2-macroglobulin family)